MKSLIVIFGSTIFLVTAPAFTRHSEDPWKVPEKYKNMKNPVTADKASVMAGKEVYMSYCISCHGENGKGGGKRSINLDIPPADFTSAEFQSQTDGALLYKVYFGHKEMPGFKKRLPGQVGINEESFGKTRIPGDLINFLRSFAKK
ncbi:c-type cytochrome [Ferruginibacter profundus]